MKKKPFEDVVLRNWLTFVLRQAVANAERECYHTPRDSLHTIRKTFRKILQDEVSLASLRGANQYKSDLIDKALLYKSVVCDKADDGGCRIKDRLFLSGP